jgi:hypothetical protein
MTTTARRYARRDPPVLDAIPIPVRTRRSPRLMRASYGAMNAKGNRCFGAGFFCGGRGDGTTPTVEAFIPEDLYIQVGAR